MKTREQQLKEKYANHPSMASGYFNHVLKPKPAKTAAQMESRICDYIEAMGGIATIIYGGARQQVKKTNVTDVMGNRNSITNVVNIRSKVVKGHSDIVASIEGETLYIEVKMKDRQSPDQKAFEKYVTDRGARYIIVHSVEELIELLPDEQLCCPNCGRTFDTPETLNSSFCCKACEFGY